MRAGAMEAHALSIAERVLVHTDERWTPVKPLWLSGPFDRSNGLCECRIAALMPVGLARPLNWRLDSAASGGRQHDDLRIDADESRA